MTVHLMSAGRVMPSLSGKTKWARKIKRKKSEKRPPYVALAARRAFLTIIIHKMLDESAVSPPALPEIFCYAERPPRLFHSFSRPRIRKIVVSLN